MIPFKISVALTEMGEFFELAHLLGKQATDPPFMLSEVPNFAYTLGGPQGGSNVLPHLGASMLSDPGVTWELAQAISRPGGYNLLPPLCFPLGISQGQTQLETSALTASVPVGRAFMDLNKTKTKTKKGWI